MTFTAPSSFPDQTAEVISIDDVFDNVRIVRAKLNSGEKPGHKPGQYTMLSLGGLEPRPFSIASTPDEDFIEFHIRNTGKSPAADVLAALGTGDTLTLGAPLGEGYWRSLDRPVLALAGGTGIAPLKAVLAAHFAADTAPAARLYWGARTKDHLYIDSHFKALETAKSAFKYVPILSDQPDDTTIRGGFINDALTADFPALDGFSIYVAGPHMMLQSLVPQLIAMGADKDFIFGDGLPK